MTHPHYIHSRSSTIIWVLISLVCIMSIGEEADVDVVANDLVANDVVANDLPFQWLPWLLSLGGKTPPACGLASADAKVLSMDEREQGEFLKSQLVCQRVDLHHVLFNEQLDEHLVEQLTLLSATLKF